MHLLHEFMHDGRQMRMYLATYRATPKSPAPVPAIEVRRVDPEMVGMESPWGRLTVNVVDGPRLGAWGIHVKTWGEGEDLAKIAMATGIFSDLQMPVRAGMAMGATWSIRPDRIRLAALDHAMKTLGVLPTRRQVLTVLARELAAETPERAVRATIDQKPHIFGFDRNGELACWQAPAAGVAGSDVRPSDLDKVAMNVYAPNRGYEFIGEPAADAVTLASLVTQALEDIRADQANHTNADPAPPEQGPFERPRD